MNCVIIDDEASAINVLKRYVSDMDKLNLLGTFQNSIEGLQFVNENPVDLIFLDINMPNLSGIGFLEIMNKKCKVIITTAYTEYAFESYQYEVIDYLLKPISFENFLKACLKALKLSPSNDATTKPVENEYFMAQTENKGKYKKVNYDDILYTEALLNYSAIVTNSGEKIVMHISLKDLLEKLPPLQFIRIHKSYVISIKQIKEIEGGEVVLFNEEMRFPIGVTFKDKLYVLLEGKKLK